MHELCIDGLNQQLGHELLDTMLRIRRFEEKCVELYSASKIRGFLHLYIGEEACATGVMHALRPEDAVVATYREHGHALARGLPMNELMAELYGKRTGSSGGRGGSMHIFDARYRFYGGHAIVGGGIPLAAGIAFADRYNNQHAVTACFFGEGAVAEGEFHETLNMAALWNLPVLFVCENNGYAMGTALKRSESVVDICAKAQSYNVAAEAVDGMDVLAVARAATQAVAKIRDGEGPCLLELRTYRFRAHSMYDPEYYRDKAEVKNWKQKGPVLLFEKLLRKHDLLNDTDLRRIESTIDADIGSAVDFAEQSDWEPVDELLRNVVAEEA